MGVYENVKRALQDIVAPELRALQVEIKRLDEKMDSFRNEVLSEIRRLDEKVDSGYKRLDEKVDSGYRTLNEKIDALDNRLEVAIDIRERLAKVEAKLAGNS